MADEIYTVPEVPEYDLTIRKLQNDDPVNAEEVLNPILGKLVENLAALKTLTDGKQGLLTGMVGQVLGFDANGRPQAQGTEDLVGPAGANGVDGRDGKSAYQSAVEAGYTGTETAFNEALVQMPNAITNDKKGVAGGVASLDSVGKVPSGQLPAMDFIPMSQKGAASGLASLDASALVPISQLPTLPISKGGTGATTADSAKKALGITDGKRTARFVVGTSTAGWTADQVDYLCDGTADNVEINAAIQALPYTGGEIVILAGTYNISDEIAVNKADVTLSGNGRGTILKRMYNAHYSLGLIHITSSNNTVQNLTIDGNKSIFPYSTGIYLSSSTNNTIMGNTCNNSGYDIYLNSSSDNTITGNTCNNDTDSGINLSSSSDNTIAGNTCNSRTGINLTSSSSNNTITGNTCNNNSTGIGLTSSSNNTITGNTCNNDTSSGINLHSSSNNTIAGNTCNNSNNFGISLTSSSNNTITGNVCNNNNTGIYQYDSGTNSITGNTCIRGTGTASDYASSQYTINIYSGDNNLIVGNNIMGKNYTNRGTNNTFANNKYN